MPHNPEECFGVLDRVFPVGEHGLREVVPECFQCPHRVECLKEALKTDEGLAFRNELLDRSAPKGVKERLKRWSERKDLNRRRKQKKGKKPWM